MNKPITILVVCLFVVSAASAQTFRYSVDLGSALDLSDNNVTTDNWMDCGNIYVESVPTLVKDDTGPVGGWTGYPLTNAPQPTPAQIGNSSVEDYANYFDIDASDQLASGGWVANPPDGLVHLTDEVGGLYFEPGPWLYLSFDDDGAPGWVVTQDIPSQVAPRYSMEIHKDWGPFGVWSPWNLSGERTETTLGLAPDPAGAETYDDDVDALDMDDEKYFFWSVDHEANMGLDPGDIYVTNRMFGGPHAIGKLDDVTNIGVSDDTDIDAWEFCLISDQTYLNIFGITPDFALPVLVGLFSVDQNDPDTVGVDESGGLIPSTVYITDLVGNHVALVDYAEYGDIDAIAVPEPATLGLLMMGGLALLRRRRGHSARS